MSQSFVPFTQRVTVLDKLDPQSESAGTVNGGAIDMLYFNRVLFLLSVGAISTNGTVDFKIQASKTSAFTSASDLTGKAITQLTQAGTNSNVVVKVGITQEDLIQLLGAGFRYSRYVLTIAVAASLVNVVVLGTDGRWRPESKFNEITGVQQTIDDAA